MNGVTIVLLLLCVQSTNAKETFNPLVLHQDVSKYINDPVITSSFHSNISLATDFESRNLLYKPDDKYLPEDGCIMGLALYKNNIRMFKRFVGSLRHFGYRGHIILGVSDSIQPEEMDYLTRHHVTLYAIEVTACDESAIGHAEVKGPIRNKCSRDIPDLKLEWGRFEMARRWLLACSACTGWSLVVDTRDTFFQDHPFRDLGSATTSPMDLFFIEEASPYSLPAGTDPMRGFVAGNIRSQVHTVPCYGKLSFKLYRERPVLCSGSIIGTRKGMLHFLSTLVTEFYENNRKTNTKCKSPHTTDQWIMNWMYYNGRFGKSDRIAALPWGLGPVLTVGKTCMTAKKKTGAVDLVPRVASGGSKEEEAGFLMNQFTQKVAPVVHQYDRCFPWIAEFFSVHSDVYNKEL